MEFELAADGSGCRGLVIGSDWVDNDVLIPPDFAFVQVVTVSDMVNQPGNQAAFWCKFGLVCDDVEVGYGWRIDGAGVRLTGYR